MKLTLIIGLVVVALLGIAKLTSSSSGSSSNSSFDSVKADIGNGGQLIDVRTAAEYSGGHIDKSINLSLQDMQAGTMPTLAKDKPVYVYCHSGNRSSQAAAILKSAGYQNVIDLGPMSHVQSIGGTLIN